jgi:hypothetical protein
VRGQQSDDVSNKEFPNGYPAAAQRHAVIGLNYVILIGFYAQAFLGIADRWVVGVAGRTPWGEARAGGRRDQGAHPP